MAGLAGKRERRGKPAHMTAHTTDGESGTSGGACRILLVEDDGPVRERLARIIGGWPQGQLMAACGTLAEAADLIGREAIDRGARRELDRGRRVLPQR